MQYSTIFKLYKPQLMTAAARAPMKYSTIFKLYKPQPKLAAGIGDREI